MIVFLFFRCPLQVLIQVLATVIEGGTVGDTRPIPFGKSVKRPPSGFVTVKEASDAPVAVQQFRRLLHVGDRVQNKAVSVTGYAKRHSGEKVHEALKHEALVSRDFLRPCQRHIFWRDAPLEKSASDFISTCHIQETDSKIPFSTHTVVQTATVTGCDGDGYATLRQIVRQR